MAKHMNTSAAAAVAIALLVVALAVAPALSETIVRSTGTFSTIPGTTSFAVEFIGPDGRPVPVKGPMAVMAGGKEVVAMRIRVSGLLSVKGIDHYDYVVRVIAAKVGREPRVLAVVNGTSNQTGEVVFMDEIIPIERLLDTLYINPNITQDVTVLLSAGVTIYNPYSHEELASASSDPIGVYLRVEQDSPRGEAQLLNVALETGWESEG